MKDPTIRPGDVDLQENQGLGAQSFGVNVQFLGLILV